MSSNTETGPQFVEETQDRGGTNRLRNQRLVDLGFNTKACDFRQVISTENMEWGQSFWPRYVSVGNTMPFQGDDDASSQECIMFGLSAVVHFTLWMNRRKRTKLMTGIHKLRLVLEVVLLSCADARGGGSCNRNRNQNWLY